MRHDDLAGEKLAKLWHQIAGVISVVATVSGLGIVITAAAGAYWHRWAVTQHQMEINKLNKELHVLDKD